jgi:hypothetical protein
MSPTVSLPVSSLRDLAEIGQQTFWLCFSFQDHGIINACGLGLAVSLQGVQHIQNRTLQQQDRFSDTETEPSGGTRSSRYEYSVSWFPLLRPIQFPYGNLPHGQRSAVVWYEAMACQTYFHGNGQTR